MSGLSLGYVDPLCCIATLNQVVYTRFLLGPPVAGALYDKFGFHGPFIFGIIVTAVDLIGRFLIIERKHAIQWGVDPAAPVPRRADPEGDALEVPVTVEPKPATEEQEAVPAPLPQAAPGDVQTREDDPPVGVVNVPATAVNAPPEPSSTPANNPAPASQAAQVHISLWAVLVKLVRSTRADFVLLCTLCYAYVPQCLFFAAVAQLTGTSPPCRCRWIIASQEPALPLHLQDVWHFNPSKVGLVYIAAVVPTLFCTSPASARTRP